VMPIAFVSNVFFPLDNAPGWLDKIASALPLKPLADQLHAAFEHTSGSGIVGDDLLTLSIWIVIGGILMMKFMRTITAKA
jgi:ABC-2 type transport system permease protein